VLRRPIKILLSKAVALGILSYSSLSLAFAPYSFHVVNPAREASKLDQIRILKTKAERSSKSDFIRLRATDLNSYLRLENDLPNLEPIEQSWVKEVDELFLERGNKITKSFAKKNPNLYRAVMAGSRIDLARKIIKKEFYYQIIKNWSCRGRKPLPNGERECLKQSLFSIDSPPDEPGREAEGKTLAFIADKLSNSLFYTPEAEGASKDYYVFEIPDLGQAEINKKTLKVGRIIFKTGHEIINHLEPGADLIKADNDDPSKAKPKSKSQTASDSAGNSNSQSPTVNQNNYPAPAPGDFSDLDNSDDLNF
jgi:hypothetical protein